MKTKKPDIFLGITMFLLVLAAVLCVLILYVQKTGITFGKDSTLASTEPSYYTADDTVAPAATGETETAPVETEAPVVMGEPIDEVGLKADLDNALDGLTSEWQVVVQDPNHDSRVTSTTNCEVDAWMTANSMVRLYVLGTAYQQVADGTLTEDQVLEDATAMISSADSDATDRLTELVGGGSLETGRQTVKDFAAAVGSKVGYNRSIAGASDQKNYVTAQQAALVLDKLCRGELVSPEMDKKMLDILFAGGSEIDLALEDGTTAGFVCDVEDGVCICAAGVMNTNGRLYVISVVCNLPVTTDGAKNKITEIATLTQPYFE